MRKYTTKKIIKNTLIKAQKAKINDYFIIRYDMKRLRQADVMSIHKALQQALKNDFLILPQEIEVESKENLLEMIDFLEQNLGHFQGLLREQEYQKLQKEQSEHKKDFEQKEVVY